MQKDWDQITIGIIHQYSLYQESLKHAIGLNPTMRVILEGDSFQDNLLLFKYNPDILLLDSSLAKKEDLKNLSEFLLHAPNTKIILLLEQSTDRDYIIRALEYGVRGFVLQEMDGELFIQAIQAVSKGEYWLHPRLCNYIVEAYQDLKHKYLANLSKPSSKVKPPYDLLTRRECEVLELMVRGYCNKSIMNELGLKEPTVKSHIQSILKKLHVPDRLNAVLMAIRHGWAKVETNEHVCIREESADGKLV